MTGEPTQTSRVKFYDAARGYGFIKPDEGGKDVFVHKSSLQWAGIQNVAEGQKVLFDARQKQDGRVAAENIRLIENEATA